jgi:hypothetical protein
MSVPNTGGWQKWQTVTRANAYLAPGTHIVRLAANSDGFNLNWISFTAAAAVGKAVPGTIQAEDFNDAGFWDSTPGNSGNSYRATDVDIERTTDAGGGFNIGWIEAGEWQEYTITVAAAGYYDFSVRVASRESSRALRVLVDGADVTGSMTVPNTGAWQAWQTLTRTPIYLTAGVHQLRSMAITGGFNVNWMSLQKSP